MRDFFRKPQRRTILFLCAALLFFLLFFCCIPTICDDWYFLNAGEQARASGGVWAAVVHFRQTGVSFGRILSSLLANALPGLPALSIPLRALLLFLLLLSLGRLSGLDRHGGPGFALVLFLLLMLPVPIFRQTYAWLSGFVNYVPAAVMLLIYLQAVAPLFSHEPIHDTALRTVLCFLLGVCIQLCMETVTVYVLIMSAAVVVWHAVRVKRLSLVAVSFLAGAILGAWLMFTSPGYHGMATDTTGYNVAPNSLGMLLYILKLNYPAFSFYSLGQFTLLHAFISVCSLALLYRRDAQASMQAPSRARIKKLLTVLLTGLPVWFFLSSRSFDEATQQSSAFQALSQTLGSVYAAIALDALLYALYVLSVCCVCLFFVRDARKTRLAIFCIASALVLGAPMLLVQPISARCFFAPYLLWALAVLLLIDESAAALRERGLAPGRVCRPCAYAAAAAVCAFYLLIYARCPEIDRARRTYTEQQMAQGAATIVLPQYGAHEYLHLPDDSIEFYYYNETYGDIPFQYIPYDQWKQLYLQPSP